MNTPDPLDQKLDQLLASRPVRPSDDFTQRVLAATQANNESTLETRRPSKARQLLTFALPLAAAIAIAITWIGLQSHPETILEQEPALSSSEAQEIFLLEESLTSLASISAEEIDGNLLATLDALYLDI